MLSEGAPAAPHTSFTVSFDPCILGKCFLKLRPSLQPTPLQSLLSLVLLKMCVSHFIPVKLHLLNYHCLLPSRRLWSASLPLKLFLGDICVARMPPLSLLSELNASFTSVLGFSFTNRMTFHEQSVWLKSNYLLL